MSKPSHRRSGSAEDAFDAAGPGLDHGTTLDSGDDPRRRSGRGSSPAPSYRSAAGAPSVHALHARKDTIIAQSLASRSRAARGGAASPSSSAAAGHGVPGGGPPRRPLLGPYPSTARGVRLWKNAVLALALWSVLETPYRNAFWGDPPSGTTPGRGLFWAALAVDLAFCADVVLRGALFLPDSAPRRAGHGTVLRAYARAQLWVDLLAALPLDVVATAAGGGRGVAFALGCTKVLRWQRLLGAFARAERDVAKSYYAVRGGRLLVLMVYHLHVFACRRVDSPPPNEKGKKKRFFFLFVFFPLTPPFPLQLVPAGHPGARPGVHLVRGGAGGEAVRRLRRGHAPLPRRPLLGHNHLLHRRLRRRRAGAAGRDDFHHRLQCVVVGGRGGFY